MTPRIRIISLASLLVLGCARPCGANEDEQVAARSSAEELAGGWSNDGFKKRDGHVTGDLKTGEFRLVQVNLYAGNDYWFTAAASKGGKVALAVYDENGKLMPMEPYQDSSRAAAGFSPPASGPYWIKVSLTEGKAASFALLYSYK